MFYIFKTSCAGLSQLDQNQLLLHSNLTSSHKQNLYFENTGPETAGIQPGSTLTMVYTTAEMYFLSRESLSAVCAVCSAEALAEAQEV